MPLPISRLRVAGERSPRGVAEQEVQAGPGVDADGPVAEVRHGAVERRPVALGGGRVDHDRGAEGARQHVVGERHRVDEVLGRRRPREAHDAHRTREDLVVDQALRLRAATGRGRARTGGRRRGAPRNRDRSPLQPPCRRRAGSTACGAAARRSRRGPGRAGLGLAPRPAGTTTTWVATQLCPALLSLLVTRCSAWNCRSASVQSPPTTIIGETPPSSDVMGLVSTCSPERRRASASGPVPHTIASCVAADPVMWTECTPSCWAR